MPETTQLTDLVINDVVSFMLYGTSITIPNIVNATLLGISSGNNLSQPVSAAATHSNIYGSLPDPKPSINYKEHTYYVVKTADGTLYEIAAPWIVKETVTRAARTTVTVILRDFDPTHQLGVLKNILENYISTPYEIIVPPPG